MKIIHVTDLHLTAPGRLLFGLDPAARLSRVLAHVRSRHADAELCVFTGDLSDTGEPAAYGVLRDSLRDFPIPHVLMMGNHDNRDNFLQVFPECPRDPAGFIQTSIDLDGRRFLFLDTLDAGQSHGLLCERRLEWLAARLEEARGVPVYVFLHHPAQSMAVPQLDAINLIKPNAFFERLLKYGNVRHLFFGHLHLQVSGALRGIPFAVNRGTCHQIVLDFAEDKLAQFFETYPVYNVVFFHDENVLVHTEEVGDHMRVIGRSDYLDPQ